MFFDCMMSLFFYQNWERSSKPLQFPNDDDYLLEKICHFQKSRSGYISTLTRVINKLTEHINLNLDIDCIKQYENKLQNATKRSHKERKWNSKSPKFLYQAGI